MKTRIISIVTVVAVSFALVLGLGVFNVAKAVPGNSGERISPPTPGVVDVVGVDRADNSLKSRDSDSRSTVFAPDTYGLHGTLRP